MNSDFEYYENELLNFNNKIKKSFISDSELIKQLIKYSKKINRNIINSLSYLSISWMA